MDACGSVARIRCLCGCRQNSSRPEAGLSLPSVLDALKPRESRRRGLREDILCPCIVLSACPRLYVLHVADPLFAPRPHARADGPVGPVLGDPQREARVALRVWLGMGGYGWVNMP